MTVKPIDNELSRLLDITSRLGSRGMVSSVYSPQQHAHILTASIDTETGTSYITDQQLAEAEDSGDLFAEQMIRAFQLAARQAGIWNHISSWKTCLDCNGEGSLVDEEDDLVVCDMCLGRGGWTDM